MQNYFNNLKSINLIQQIHKIENKNHTIISKDVEKEFDKTKHLFQDENI